MAQRLVAIMLLVLGVQLSTASVFLFDMLRCGPNQEFGVNINCAGRCQRLMKTCHYGEPACYCQPGFFMSPDDRECLTASQCNALQGPDFYFKVQTILNTTRGYTISCDSREECDLSLMERGEDGRLLDFNDAPWEDQEAIRGAISSRERLRVTTTTPRPYSPKNMPVFLVGRFRPTKG